MDTLVDSAEARIARRIQLERTSRGWSLADLAGKSGVAKASISKIERGEVSPSAGILVRIAAAFDLTLAGLLLRAEETSRLFRRADQPQWTRSQDRLCPAPDFLQSQPPAGGGGGRDAAGQEGELSRFVLCESADMWCGWKRASWSSAKAASAMS